MHPAAASWQCRSHARWVQPSTRHWIGPMWAVGCVAACMGCVAVCFVQQPACSDANSHVMTPALLSGAAYCASSCIRPTAVTARAIPPNHPAQALDISPVCPEAYNVLAQAAADTYEEALDFYKKAVELGPQVGTSLGFRRASVARLVSFTKVWASAVRLVSFKGACLPLRVWVWVCVSWATTATMHDITSPLRPECVFARRRCTSVLHEVLQ
jgi:hypothetical protein